MNTAKRGVCDCLVVSLALNRLLFFPPHHRHRHHHHAYSASAVCCALCAWRFVVLLNALQQHMSKLGRAKHTKTMMMMWRYDDMKVSRLVRLPFFPFSRTMLLCLIQGMLAHIHIQWRIIHGKYCHCTPRSVKIVKTLKTLHINAYHRKQHYWSNAMCALKIQTQSTPKRGDNS